jgi:MSHA pilin protein MshD
MYTRARGVTLIELAVFIAIVGVAMAGLFAAFNTITAASADPQVRKQVLAIAESLMDEVALMPFTYCDPDDPQATTAQSSAVGATGCTAAAAVENIGPESTPPYGPETRYSATTPFDNVNDYSGFSMAGIRDITNNPIGALSGYTATITVTQAGLASGANAIAAADALLISIAVTGPSGTSVTLEGYRTRYAPTTIP